MEYNHQDSISAPSRSNSFVPSGITPRLPRTRFHPDTRRHSDGEYKQKSSPPRVYPFHNFKRTGQKSSYGFRCNELLSPASQQRKANRTEPDQLSYAGSWSGSSTATENVYEKLSLIDGNHHKKHHRLDNNKTNDLSPFQQPSVSSASKATNRLRQKYRTRKNWKQSNRTRSLHSVYSTTRHIRKQLRLKRMQQVWDTSYTPSNNTATQVLDSAVDSIRTDYRSLPRVAAKSCTFSEQSTPMRPQHDDANLDDEESSEDEITTENYKFDVAKTIPRERVSSSDAHKGLLKVLRAMLYGLLLLCLTACLATATVTFLLLEAAVNKNDMYRWFSINQLMYIICIPHVILLVQSTLKCLFGDHLLPSPKLFFVVLMVEITHTFGIALLVFCVLPSLNSVEALGIMNAVAIIPIVLKLLFTTNQSDQSAITKMRRLFCWILNTVALGLQLAVVFNHVISVSGVHIRSHQDSAWQLPVSLICVSIKWWENFVSENRFFFKLRSLKQDFHKTRVTCAAMVSGINIILTIGFFLLFEWIYQTDVQYANYFNPPHARTCTNDGIISDIDTSLQSQSTNNVTLDDEICGANTASLDNLIEMYIPGILCVLTSLLAYYLSDLACKLKMQVMSFSIPLLITPAVVLGWMLLICHGIIHQSTSELLKLHFLCMEFDYHLLIFACIAWLSLVWITRHIWTPDIERLATNQRIFVTSLYSGPLICQSLMLNRRNDIQDKDYSKLYSAEEEDTDLSSVISNNEAKLSNTLGIQRKQRVVPKVYACGTMWHETKHEMIQLLKSLMRMDKDQNARMIAEDFFHVIDPDYYDFEAHIFFDDCVELDDSGNWVPNKFVVQFINCLSEAASSVHKETRELDPCIKTPTPYGARLKWTLPCGNTLYVHLKDKHKIRHRKRWSQVMYMYYLLGYRLFEEPEDEIENMITNSLNGKPEDDRLMPGFGRSDIFQEMSFKKLQEAENTFILALDGDVDFTPDAVRLLVDRMKVNPRTGAACGRIHPIGSGPMVWYQDFEYAVSHWFQKATEHVLGCVLCSPGCFSLLRGSALLDDNVMRRYATTSTHPAHYIQYDQGEDRWLCTLLLQQGYRIDYCAASDALTYAPDTFHEFFNQRRRWTPSTFANSIDLLSEAKTTVTINANISYPYIWYQYALMLGTVLGPSTIVITISTAFVSVFGYSLFEAYMVAVMPVFFYLLVCFNCKTDTQINVGALLSAFYACIMIVVSVGVIQSVALNSIINPSLIFFAFLTLGFIIAGLIHPYEMGSLVHGFLYFLCIPAGYLILAVYAMSNLHNVSWGTRELPRKVSKQNVQQSESNHDYQGLLAALGVTTFLGKVKANLKKVFAKIHIPNSKQDQYFKIMINEMQKLRKRTPSSHYNNVTRNSSDSENFDIQIDKSFDQKSRHSRPRTHSVVSHGSETVQRDDMENPRFLHDPRLGNGPIEELSKKEALFFNRLIHKYLKPIKRNEVKEKETKRELLRLRTTASFGYWFVNLLWLLFNYMVTADSDLNAFIVNGYKIQPLGCVFLVFFLMILFTQLFGMISHRWSTFLQLLSITELGSPLRKRKIQKRSQLTPNDAIKLVQTVQMSETFFDSDSDNLELDDISHRTSPEARTRNAIENTLRYANRDRSYPVRRRLRRPYGGGTETDIEDRISRLSEHYDRSMHSNSTRRYKQRTVNYRDTIRRHFAQQFGYLTQDQYPRHGNHTDKASSTNARATEYIRRTRPFYGNTMEGINVRARRRLNLLARYPYV